MRTPCSALVLALVLLAGCSPSAPPSPSPRPTTAITAQVLGQILDEHAPGAFAIAGGDGVLSANQPTEFVRGIEATAYHRATPGHPAQTLTVRYSPTPFNDTVLCPAKSCTPTAPTRPCAPSPPPSPPACASAVTAPASARP